MAAVVVSPVTARSRSECVVLSAKDVASRIVAVAAVALVIVLAVGIGCPIEVTVCFIFSIEIEYEYEATRTGSCLVPIRRLARCPT